MRKTIITFSALALVLSARPSAAALKEIWAQSRIAGSAAGYYHESSAARPDGNIATLIENVVILNRMGSKVEIKSTAEYVEAEDGRLLTIDSTSSSSAQSTTMHVVNDGNSLTIRTGSGGKSYLRTVPLSAPPLGPEAARRLTVARLRAAGDTVSYLTFSPELGTPATITAKCLATHPLEIEQSMSAMPVKVTVWLDPDGWLRRQIFPSPFGSIETVRASRETVLSGTGGGAALPAESFRSTLVTSNIRLPEERLIEEVKIRITHLDPQLGWPDFTATNQTVVESARDHVVLRMRRVAEPAGERRPSPPPGKELLPFLSANALVQSDDPRVKQVAESVAGGESDTYRAARKLQQWTAQHMTFDPGIAVAPASEVVRNRRGTCLGYAILLASLLRTDGIPARIRMGFVYAGGIWGGHAWVEMLADKEWVPLDAALYSPGPADAARFSFFTSALEEGTISGMGALARLYGHVKIDILEYTIHGRRVAVPPDAKPFTTAGNTYRNPWLGVAVTKPAGFRFTSLESVWPASTVVAMEGPGGESVRIEDRSASLPATPEAEGEEMLRAEGIAGARREMAIGGRRWNVAASASRAGTVVRHGGEVLVVIARGQNPLALLAKVVSTLHLGPE